MWLLSSPNLLSAAKPHDVTWRLLPDGDCGIKPVGGHETSNIEEAHVLPLMTVSDGGFGHASFGARCRIAVAQSAVQ